MLERQTIPIRDVYAGMYDGPHATPKPSNSGPIFLGIKNVGESGQLDLSNVRHISEKEYPRWIKRVEPKYGDIVFSYEATLNRYALIPKGFRGCLGRRMALIRPDESKICGRFLYYYFYGQEWRNVIAQNTLIGATVDRIPIAKFPDFPITIPSLPTQRKIASILSAYDDLIEKNALRIKILEEMARRIYEEWFVHFRFPGHENVRMVESELGPIPEGWGVATLADSAFLTMGQSPKSEFYNSDGIGMPFHQGVTNFNKHFPTHQTYCTAEGRKAEDGDILMSVRAPVGRINLSPSCMVIGRGLCAMRSKSGKQCLLLHRLLEKFREEDSMGSGSIFKAVTKNDVQGIRFVNSPDELSEHFETTVGPIWNLIKNLTNKNTNLRTTRDLLLPKLISGEIDVFEVSTISEKAVAA